MLKERSPHSLAAYLADRAPLFYREPQRLVSRLGEGYFVTAIRETLRRLPTSERFRESHFGEIAAAVFAEEVLGLTRIYSKLSYLTAENANAYKMDLLMADFRADPLVFVWGEVKSSVKSRDTESPPYHSGSCYPAIFDSLREYEDSDRDFDLVSVQDNLERLTVEQQRRVREALLPYSQPNVRYAAFAVIDRDTVVEEETQVLHTRTSRHTFDVDIIGIEALPLVVGTTWSLLDNLRAAAERIR
jgi:hypothetical protein